ncbi:class I SAM-dependent methyltransferase [Cyanothece sp. BG0011]|uniref:class I SAM-dependent methyltransferase n=1 Tax=Cyanothece sp. BG0011 TaxID=2082950 RepID=UPI000D1E9CD6|nr:class I SAM-dependent methyltransferase [Cyanothece sp. BG0011]
MTTNILKPKDPLAIASELLDILNHGALSLMISIGHRTQLFDVMANLPPSTSDTIAEAAGLNERYVREWLGAMVMGGIITYHPNDRTYELPSEYAAFLTRQATPNNMAVAMQFIPVLAQVEDEIIRCFQQGGGLPYTAYPRFHEVMAEDSGQSVVAVLDEGILPLVPRLTANLSEGITVLDVGCGGGKAITKLAQLYPRSQFVGVDVSEEAIALAKSHTEALGLHNLTFEVQDAANLNFQQPFDLITAFDAIHDQAYPDQVLKNIYENLKDQGIFLMQDIRASRDVHQNLDHPARTFLYTVSCLHCMSVSLANNGAGLGTVWGEETALEMLQDVGFQDISVKQLPHDPMNNFYIVQKNTD